MPPPRFAKRNGEGDKGGEVRVHRSRIVDYGFRIAEWAGPIAHHLSLIAHAHLQSRSELSYSESAGRGEEEKAHDSKRCAVDLWRGGSAACLGRAGRSGGGTKVPVDRPTFVQGTGTGLTGIYWDNPDYTDHRISRIDPVVDFSWGAQTPDPSISAPTFSAKWVGQVQAQYSEVYTFIIEAPGGYDGTVILNEQMIIDSSQGENAIVYSTPTALVAGQWYDIEVAYRSYGGTAGIKLKWSSPSDFPGGLIPQWALSSPVVPSAPAGMGAYAGGPTKISLFWKAATGATGYNIYRSQTSGGQNYMQPVNSSAPVNTPSYAGSSYRVFTDTGVTQGQRYFYTVKAVYGWFESSPTLEDSDIPSSNAVPWETRNASTILSAIGSSFDLEPEGAL